MADQLSLGRRKTSVARVILRNGTGTITINKSEFEKAFPQLLSREDILAPFKVTEIWENMMYLLMLTAVVQLVRLRQ
jgi:ribosomal protein S9